MRFSPSWLALLLILGAVMATASVRFEQDGLRVERILEVQSSASISPTTGARHNLNQSVLTLILSNPSSVDRQNVTLTEDLTYLPSYVRLVYSVQPAQSDGRAATWSVPVLRAGASVRYTISVPASVSEVSMAQAAAPRLTSNRPAAELSAPTLVDSGARVELRLLGDSDMPISAARIQVSAPDGQHLTLTTDSTGRAAYSASQAGYYSYSIPDYALAFIPSTQVRAPVASIPATSGALVALPNASASSAPVSPLKIDLGSLWPMLGGLLFIGMLALGLYAYFTRSPTDDAPTPPAPATRPALREHASGSAPSADPSTDGRSSDSAGSRSSSDDLGSSAPRAPAPASDTSPSASASRPASDARPASMGSASGSSPIRTVPADPSDDASVRTQTRALLAARRSPVPRPAQPSPAPAASASRLDIAAEMASLSSPTRPASGLASGEQTRIAAASDEDDDDDGAPVASVSDPIARSSLASSVPTRAAPAWMTQPAAQSESVEVDDEAIAKTISELEALRDELRARRTGRAPDSSLDSMPDEDDEDTDEPSASSASSALDSGSAPRPRLASLSEQLAQVRSMSEATVAESASSKLPEAEAQEVEAILSAEPAAHLSPEEEARIEQEAAAIDTAAKASDSDDDEPSIFTPTPATPESPRPPSDVRPLPRASASKSSAPSAPAPRPRGRPPQSKRADPRPAHAIPIAKPAWKEVKSAPIAPTARRGPGRPRKDEVRAPARPAPAELKRGPGRPRSSAPRPASKSVAPTKSKKASKR